MIGERPSSRSGDYPSGEQSPPWFGSCPACRGPAVYAVVCGEVVGACSALTVPCYWSARGEEAEQAGAASMDLPL